MANAHTYFYANPNYFWQWEDDFTVIAIPNGNTIIYKQELFELLETLTPKSLPPLGVVLSLIAVCNDTAEDSGAQLLEHYRKIETRKLISQILIPDLYPIDKEVKFDAISNFFKQLAALPVGYKRPQNRALLFATLLEKIHPEIPAERYEIPDLLVLKKVQTHFSWEIFHKETYALYLLAKQFPTTQSMLDRLANLVPIQKLPLQENASNLLGNLVQNLLIHKKNATSNTQEIPSLETFLEGLLDKNQTFRIGALIPHLWAGLHIPLQAKNPSSQALGGISDIANKGSYDRLLISEFAYDDLMFMSRLANQEVLFLNKEIPPQQETTKRIILIDVSLKNWGIPKTLAYSIAIALGKDPKSDFEVSFFRVANTYEAVSMQTVEEVIESIQIVEKCLLPTQGLIQFFKDHPKNALEEIIFITHEDVLNAPAFREVAAPYRHLVRYWIGTHAEGNINIYKQEPHKKTLLQTLTLPLPTLWQRKPNSKQSESKPLKSFNHLPILLGGVVYPQQELLEGDYIFQITKNGGVFRHNLTNNPRLAWELVIEQLPKTGQYTLGRVNDELILLIFDVQNKKIVLLSLDTLKQEYIDVSQEFSKISYFENLSFIFDEGVFYYPSYNAILCLYADGNKRILNRESISIEQYNFWLNIPKKEAETLKKASKPYNTTILKKVNSVFINDKNLLVFNKHAFVFTPHQHLKLELTTNTHAKTLAHTTDNQNFNFPDGSSVYVSKAGFFVFTSSNPEIPTLFVPSMLDASLSMATETEQTGNSLYLNVDKSYKKTNVSVFWHQYYLPFLQTILDYSN